MKTRKRLVTLAAAAAMSLGLFAAPAGAAHCTDIGAPGNSDFAEHVKANAGNNGHNEGAHKGWATCEANSSNFGG